MAWRRYRLRFEEFFGKPAMYMGSGSIRSWACWAKFPGAQFMITGVLGPHSNAHGPNEFLHIPTGKRVTACVAGGFRAFRCQRQGLTQAWRSGW